MICSLSQRVDGKPCTNNIHRRHSILDDPMSTQDAKDVKYVVSVVGKRERVHYCVVVDCHRCYSYKSQEQGDPGKNVC